MAGPAKKAAAARPPSLPPVVVAKFELALELVEDLVDTNTDLFVEKGQEYRSRHRMATERKLTAEEAAFIAAGMPDAEGLPPVVLAAAVQESDLKAYDEPAPMEILLAAGIATAPAFMRHVRRFVALIEMPTATFEAAHKEGQIEEALDEAVIAMDYVELAGENGARVRAQRAFEHFSAASGAEPGKATALLIKSAWRAIERGVVAMNLTSQPASLIGSPPSTDGLADPSSTSSPTARAVG